MIKCIGCGSQLQTTNPDKIGYVPEKKGLKADYCERCFKLTHYHKYQDQAFLPGNNDKIIDKINSNQAVSFFLVDFLNINREVINLFKKLNDPKVFVISKFDIIPRSMKKNSIKEWLRAEYDLAADIEFISSKVGTNINVVFRKLDVYNYKKAYITGFTNVGKSTFINTLIKDQRITTSSIPNTTLNFIKIEFEDITIIDCPGFSYQKAFYSDNYNLAKLNPKKSLKPITYQTKPNQCYLIDNKIKIYCLDENSFTFYVPLDINIKRLWDQTAVDQINYQIENDSDLVIKTLGFINIKKECQIGIVSELNDLIEIRHSCF